MSEIISWIGLAGILLFVIPIFLRLIFHIPYIIIGSSIPIIIFFILATNIKLDRFNEKEYNELHIKKFEFFKFDNWLKNLDISKNDLDTTSDKQIYPENFLINDTLNNLVSLILRDFVDSWFIKISPDLSFNVALRHEFTYIIKILYNRLSSVDFSDLLVHNITPILNDHVEKFLKAQEITRNTKVSKTTISNDKISENVDDSVLASNYNRGILHAGIKIKSTDKDKDMNSYLNNVINKILPFLLEENEIQSIPVRILIRQLLICCVINPICSMLSEPDFFNQIIVSTLSKQMKDRNNVKKFRNILRRHSMTFNDLALTNPIENDILQYKLSIDTPKQDFEKIINILESSNDIKSLLKYKYYTMLRNEKILMLHSKPQIEESKILQKYFKRCTTLIDTIDTKLVKLKGDAEVISSETDPKQISSKLINKKLSLHEILSSPIRLEYFNKYMQQRGDRQLLLDFWLSAESLRNPLESNNIQSKSFLTNLNTSDDDEESSDEETAMFVDNQLTQAGDIKNIFIKYFNLSVMKIPPKIFYKVSEFIEGNCSSTLAYYRARKNILKLQDFEYMRMKKSDFVAFQSSDLWLKLLVEEAVSNTETKINESLNPDLSFSDNNDNQLTTNIDNTKTESSDLNETPGDPLAEYSEKEGDSNYVDVNMTGKVSDKVVKAVEDALNEIMNDNGKSDVDLMANAEKRNSRLVTDDVARDLFGTDQKSLFGENSNDENEIDCKDTYVTDQSQTKSNNNNNNNIELNNKDLDENTLTNSQDDVSLSSDTSDDRMEKSDFKVVGPSVLNLSNEIERLNVEIDRLQKQRMILKALLQKAEIINNVPELRILRKSLISLEKELKFKSMQKEQYIVQEGENSLFQRAKVTIPSYITAKDKNGRNFIMYVIKVTTLSRSDPNKITANWMVTRRFSQFYELHHYLKTKYPFLATVDFPKKKLMMKFIQNSLIDERQKKLKTYLQVLVSNKDICTDKIFRDFLSSETFDTTLNDTLQNINEKNKSVDGSGTRLYNIISSQALYPLLSLANNKNITDKSNKTTSDKLKMNIDKNDVLNEIDDSYLLDDDGITTPNTRTKDISFIKPICDLIISVFQLNHSTSWLRGRALVLLFQQLFGSTVEKVLRTNIDGKIKNEENVSEILTNLQVSLWPDGNFKKKKIPRSNLEKERTKQQTKILLSAFLNDTTSKIFGQNAANKASETLYAVIQNEILNRHLVLCILDEILNTLFPEINE